MPRRLQASLGLIAAALALAACSGSSSAPTSGPAVFSSAPTGSQTTPVPSAPPARLARRTAARYITALALGHAAQARSLAAAQGADGTHSLEQLARWLDDVPVARVDVKASASVRPPDAPAGDVAVSLALRARLASRAGTGWVPLGTRVLVLAPGGAGWRVAADATSNPALAVEPSGLSVFAHPHVLRGAHVTVAYGPGQARLQADEVRRFANAAVPDIHGTYGGGTAAADPLVFLVATREQAAQLIGRDVGQALPVGSVAGSFAYIFLRQYRRVDPAGRGGAVTALITMLATRLSLAHAPTSLRVGVASYEENRYLNHQGYVLPLDRIAAVYPDYPALRRWTNRDSLWGLRGPAQQLASEDALAMVHVILTRHGGAPAVRRLGKAFRHVGSDVTTADVRRAFQQGLGVSFATVAGEAHAYAKGGSWKFG